MMEQPHQQDQLQVLINENTWIVSNEGKYFYFGKDHNDSIQIICELEIFPINNNIEVGSSFYFSSNHTYGIVNKDNQIVLFKNNINDDTFSLVGQLLPKSIVNPF